MLMGYNVNRKRIQNYISSAILPITCLYIISTFIKMQTPTTGSNASLLMVFHILYTFLIFPHFFSVSMHYSSQCSFFNRCFQVVRKNTERIHSEKRKSFPPFPHSSEGLPVTSFFSIPPEMFSVECNFIVKTSCNYKRGLLV